jgi:hypothetical protein
MIARRAFALTAVMTFRGRLVAIARRRSDRLPVFRPRACGLARSIRHHRKQPSGSIGLGLLAQGPNAARTHSIGLMSTVE